MSVYSTIQFDLDGTLVDSIPVIIEAFQLAIERVYGKREDNPEVLKNSIGLPLKQFFSRYPQKDQTLLTQVYIAAYQDMQNKGIPLFCGIMEMLIELKNAGIRLALVTSKRLAPTHQLVKDLRMDELFEVIVVKETTERHKPYGDPILKAAELMSTTDLTKILYVGDSVHDLHCARNAGVDVAIVDWTRMEKEELKNENPTFWVDRPEDLCQIVLKNYR